MSRYRRPVILLSCLTSSVFFSFAADTSTTKTKHIIFVMTDGFRREEMFTGADKSLMNKEYGKVTEPAVLEKAYWRPDATIRREALLPFIWTKMAKEGQIYGNWQLGSEAYLTNGLNFSYPGYSETFCGFADGRINSNDKVLNPNRTVFEWLNERPAFHDQIAAFGAWDLFPFILNVGRSHLTVNAGYDAFEEHSASPTIRVLNQVKAETPRVWPDEPFDVLPFRTAEEYLKVHKPALLYISLGETDEWAHAGDYTQYLESAHRADAYLRQLWDDVQAMPDYRDNTTLIFSPDHGRGLGLTEWKDHGQKVPNSRYIWMAFMGPDTPPKGERAHVPAVTQSQIAATVAALLGEDYRQAVPKSGAPIADVLGH